jgi:4-hydroxy-3-methylbut-2-en-1-yl diphosphate reductase
MEVERLTQLGLEIISQEDLKTIFNAKVLIRAHGEPPETYKIALNNNLQLIDASCPVVLKLQNLIRRGAEEMHAENGQIVIYGKEGHAEVNGLVGQTLNNAIIVNHDSDIEKIDFKRPIRFYSQTTQPVDGFEHLIKIFKDRIQTENPGKNPDFIAHNTICSQVSHREPGLKIFAANHDVIVFVSGKKSSNGLFLFEVCKSINERSYWVSEKKEIQKSWFASVQNVGVCGATSTPMWLMEEVAEYIKGL